MAPWSFQRFLVFVVVDQLVNETDGSRECHFVLKGHIWDSKAKHISRAVDQTRYDFPCLVHDMNM